MTALDALGRAIDVYYELGWRLVPVVIDPREGSKHPASAGTTGAGGAWLTNEEVRAGLVHRRGSWPGIGIRPEPGVLGVDVADYGGRTGGRTIRDLSADAEVLGWTGLGRLPATWRSSARSDGISGIYWYRYYPGRWRPVRDVGTNVELVRWDVGSASPRPPTTRADRPKGGTTPTGRRARRQRSPTWSGCLTPGSPTSAPASTIAST